MRKALLSGLFLLSAAPAALAVGFKTQLNCASDYYAYCSQFPVGSPQVRQCMRDNGPRLSKACISALIADGEVSAEEVERKKQQITAAKAKPKVDPKAEPRPEPEPRRIAKQKTEPEPSQKVVVRTPEPPARVARQIPPAAAVVERPVLAETLDEATYEALRRRGARFVVTELDLAEGERSGAGQASPSAPRRAEPPTLTATAERTTPLTTPAPKPTNAAAMAPVERPAAAGPARSVDYPSGRMALGNKPSAAEPAESRSADRDEASSPAVPEESDFQRNLATAWETIRALLTPTDH